jgi:hypothetical protein
MIEQIEEHEQMVAIAEADECRCADLRAIAFQAAAGIERLMVLAEAAKSDEQPQESSPLARDRFHEQVP